MREIRPLSRPSPRCAGPRKWSQPRVRFHPPPDAGWNSGVPMRRTAGAVVGPRHRRPADRPGGRRRRHCAAPAQRAIPRIHARAAVLACRGRPALRARDGSGRTRHPVAPDPRHPAVIADRHDFGRDFTVDRRDPRLDRRLFPRTRRDVDHAVDGRDARACRACCWPSRSWRSSAGPRQCDVRDRDRPAAALRALDARRGHRARRGANT